MIPNLPERKTLNGKFGAYCKACWSPVYVLWIADEDHEGKCPMDFTRADECPNARAFAEGDAAIAKCKATMAARPR
jgi:hypothetical protein